MYVTQQELSLKQKHKRFDLSSLSVIFPSSSNIILLKQNIYHMYHLLEHVQYL